MKRILSIVLAVLLALPLTCSLALAEEDRPVLTIGDVSDRSDTALTVMTNWPYGGT